MSNQRSFKNTLHFSAHECKPEVKPSIDSSLKFSHLNTVPPGGQLPKPTNPMCTTTE